MNKYGKFSKRLICSLHISLNNDLLFCPILDILKLTIQLWAITRDQSQIKLNVDFISMKWLQIIDDGRFQGW